MEVLTSKSLIDSYISCDEFVSLNNELREYNEMKKEIKNRETLVEYTIQKQWTRIACFVKYILLTKIQALGKLK